MDEYPKVIVVGGVRITANNADDEARWRKPALSGTVVVPPAPVVDPTPEPVSVPAADPAPPSRTRRKSDATKKTGSKKKP